MEPTNYAQDSALLRTDPLPPTRAPVAVADVMRPAVTVVERNDHCAAVAYLMKHTGMSSLVVMTSEHGGRKPVGIITEADIVRAVAGGKSLNDVRTFDLMTGNPVVISVATSIGEAARTMVAEHIRHLPVVGDDGSLRGIVDILDICRALLLSLADCPQGTDGDQAQSEPTATVAGSADVNAGQDIHRQHAPGEGARARAR